MRRNSKEFKKLQSEWYQKLKTNGFDDIESKEGSLKGGGFSSNANTPGHKAGYYWDQRETYNQSKQEYYRLAGHFLHEHKFENKVEQYIWELHSNGISLRSIEGILEKLPQLKFKGKRDKILSIIHRLMKKMKELYFE